MRSQSYLCIWLLLDEIKSSRMRKVGHVARIGEKRNGYRLLEGKIEGVH
jgi:hypothetical protein